MELFARPATPAPTSAPSTKVERALADVLAARQSRRLVEAVDRANAALTWGDTALVRRELRVGLARELGFAQTLLGQVQPARDALLMALDAAAQDSALIEPVRAGLSTLELMQGDSERARQHLDAKTAHRRACLSALARVELFEGRFVEAERLLQEADHAPGGTSADGVLHPPATVLRCFGAVWSRRPDQARMLYDGVATRDNPVWQLVRVPLLRALWVQSGDARYLQLALAAAEQLRFADQPETTPGFAASAAAMHAACLLLTGDVALAVETADIAMSALDEAPDMTLPEWPRAAILFDCAMVYRDAGDDARHKGALARWDHLGWSSWAERMALVAGPRAARVTSLDEAEQVGDPGDGNLEVFAVKLLEDPRNARLSALRALGGATRALGVEWLSPEWQSLCRIGARPRDEESPSRETEVISLSDRSVLRFYKPQRDALRRVDKETVEAIARVVALREDEARRLEGLHDDIARADASRRLAEERLEQVRRPGTDRTHGGRFPTVVGRSDAVRTCLDRLALLAGEGLDILLEGAPGTGRRHLAHAATSALLDDPTGSVRVPTLDLSLLEGPQQLEALDRLTGRAAPGAESCWVVLANAQHLDAAALSWLLEHLERDASARTRWVLTLDARDATPAAMRLREVLAPSRVRVPGLDERLEDVPLLTDAFLREIGRRPDELSTAARALLARRVFSGHVAELRTTIRHAVVRAPAGTIQPEHFESHAPPEASQGAFDPDEALLLGLSGALTAFKRSLVQKALDATLGNRSRAADLLGVPRARFAKLARDLGMAEPEPEPASEPTQQNLLDAHEGP